MQSGLIRIGAFSGVATHWLPNIIRAFQKDYPGIDYELLMGDDTQIEMWIAHGRVDCGFLSLPAPKEFETIDLEEHRLLAILPKGHPPAEFERVRLAALCGEAFLLLEKGERTEVSLLFVRHGLTPRVHFTTWDDYAIVSMVESGLGISILPELILRRIPYVIVICELDVPAKRAIALAMRDRENASIAVQRFLEYLPCRNGTQKTRTLPEKQGGVCVFFVRQ